MGIDFVVFFCRLPGWPINRPIILTAHAQAANVLIPVAYFLAVAGAMK